ncbi:phosphoribosylglycinamide formyltransferase [Methylotuvimicrobium alcaliphilum]|uniref:Phosphoribosylglycinamide formyltransferase n=1 Tax=Methylotuvimicrobium alcaliphilum (strain DSM 19304 / NCIMB 14124 / VKM B-2133 / 20Z) TaxID=1091494 RepID=G4SWZ0_META2|nr:phosphoribosylglycinamide formyltransferase [Methylotuvimicrobium alcaliphilum]CCE23045.1 putative phosphoribosylglycinamide formyltransferase/formyltetrahydrofolate deformylase [Methylotuvimicrobium alcaliphilum 20Z]
MKISFLASHGGSSARKIIETIEQGGLPGFEIGILITNNKDSAIYDWCLTHGIEVFHISSKTHSDNEDQAIKKALQSAGTELIVLSGYMKKIGPQTLSAYSGKILNIHPSLLPKFGGRGMYGDFVHAAVLEAGETVSGATVHFVTDAYDEGPLLLQKEVPVLSGDTVESLGQRVRAIEGDLYINALKRLLTTTDI